MRNRIMPPCLPGQFCDRLEELQIEGVRRIYSPIRNLSNTGEEIHALMLGILLGVVKPEERG